MKILSRAVLCCFLFTFCASTQAAIFCVSNGVQLQQALAASASNGEEDTIRLLEGLYSASAGTEAFTYDSTNHEGITLIGGYSSPGGQPCSLLTNQAHLTVLSGSGVRRVLSISQAMGRVFNLTIRDGFSATSGGGMRMDASGARDFVVGNVIFEGNASQASGGALEIIADVNATLIQGNLFYNNRCGVNACAFDGHFNAPEGTIFHVFFFANTVVGNSCSSGAPPACATGGVKMSGTARSLSHNNAFAYNGGFDFDIQGASGALYNSNVPNRAGTFTPSSGNLALVDPGFVNPALGNFRLAIGSPLIDSGTSSYGMPNYDLDGINRVLVVPDMGAYERPYDPLFSNGFDN